MITQQSTRLVSVRAELAVLRGMCDKNKVIAGTLLSSVDSSYFYSEESIELFTAIQKHLAINGESPSYKLIIEDPDLSIEARIHLKNSVVTITSFIEATKAAEILNKYRQVRGLFTIAANIGESLKGGKLDLPQLMQDTADAINTVRTKKASKDSFTNFGVNNSSNKIISDLLYADNSDATIPTGFEHFDKVSGGFARGALVTIGANSGGGKCQKSDTKILLADGVSTITLGEIWDSANTEITPVVADTEKLANYKNISLQVMTYEGVQHASKVFKTKAPTIRVTFDDGRTVEGSAEHMFMCKDSSAELGYSWQRLDQLTLDSNVFSLEEMSEFLKTSK